MKYHRFEAEDVAEILRYEIEARQAKEMAEREALTQELVGPYKTTWDFWKILFDRRDVKALADFEAGKEFQSALEHRIRVLETSPAWAHRPERDGLLFEYRRRRVGHGGMESTAADPDSRGETQELREGRQAAQTGETHDVTGEGAVADLFDPVSKEQLEAMFPDSDKWASYAERQSRNGLKDAAFVSRAKFNPYRAAQWWVDTQSPSGWTWERCLRKLASNLPPRSRDSKHLLTGDFD